MWVRNKFRTTVKLIRSGEQERRYAPGARGREGTGFARLVEPSISGSNVNQFQDITSRGKAARLMGQEHFGDGRNGLPLVELPRPQGNEGIVVRTDIEVTEESKIEEIMGL